MAADATTTNGGSEAPRPVYEHRLLHARRPKTMPAEIPDELADRWVLRETIRARASHSAEVVYYLRMPNGLIKIGTTRWVADRVRELEGRYEPGVEVLATEPGGVDLERDRQHLFRKHVSGRGEYFEPVPELLGWISSICAAWGPPMITRRVPADWPFPI